MSDSLRPHELYWSGEPFPSPGDLPNPGIKPRQPPTSTHLPSIIQPATSHHSPATSHHYSSISHPAFSCSVPSLCQAHTTTKSPPLVALSSTRQGWSKEGCALRLLPPPLNPLLLSLPLPLCLLCVGSQRAATTPKGAV